MAAHNKFATQYGDVHEGRSADTLWRTALHDTGCATYDEYVAPVKERYAMLCEQHKQKNLPSPDRNDIFRDCFNALVDQNKLSQNMLDEFYGGRTSIFPRIVAFEGSACRQLANLANIACITLRTESLYPALDRAFEHFQTTELNIFDHGAGFFQDTARCFTWSPQVSVTAYDYDIPWRNVVAAAFKRFTHLQFEMRYVRDDIKHESLETIAADAEHYHVIVTNEVLEHCFNPVETLRALVRKLKPGGVLYCSTFFNSCNGHDPSHLLSGEVYQDCDMWFDAMTSMGLHKLHYDPRGICKVWKKDKI